MYLAIGKIKNKTTLTFSQNQSGQDNKANGDKCWWGCGKGKHVLLVGLQTGTVTMEIRFFFQKARSRSIMKPSIPPPGHIPKVLYYRDTCFSMFFATVFTIARKYK